MIGPLFTRQWRTTPRRTRFYFARTLYPGALLIFMATAYLLVTGNQIIRKVGDLAIFGTLLFQFLSLVQLTLAAIFPALLVAAAVAQEKERGTLNLLLMTRLTSAEIVLGQLGGSLLGIVSLLAAGLPVFMIIPLLGGVAFDRVAEVFLITVATMLVSGSIGALLGFWREKAFQTLALTVLVLFLWAGAGELVASGWLGQQWLSISVGQWAAWISPFRAVEAVTAAYQPGGRWLSAGGWSVAPTVLGYLAGAITTSLLLVTITMLRLREWTIRAARRGDPQAAGERETFWRPEAGTNSPEEPTTGTAPATAIAARTGPENPQTAAATVSSAAPDARLRKVWRQPVIWRELRTWAYGRKVILIKLLYLALAIALGVGLWQLAGPGGLLRQEQAAYGFAPLLALSLLLVNALAVTSICSERDGRTLDLLLATELKPTEVIFGKLGGVLYNTKEMLAAPMVLAVVMSFLRDYRGMPLLTGEELGYFLIDWVIVSVWVMMLGIHVGMNFASSRQAAAVSLGTLIFLFLGISSCMRMIMAFGGSFGIQLQAFTAVMLGGGLGLFAALGNRNPSLAMGLATLLLPFLTFYAMTSYLLEQQHLVFVVVSLIYGFGTAAMLVPALSEFDFATANRSEPDE